MADDDYSVYFLLKQVNYFLPNHIPTHACYLAEKKKSIATDKHSWFTTSTEVVTMLIQEVLGNPQYFT